MEKKFRELLDPEESDSFINFSKAMKNLADVFKVNKPSKSLDENERLRLHKKSNFKKN